MTRSFKLQRLLYGSNLCRTKYFASFYFHFHQNHATAETGMDKKIWALGNLPEEKKGAEVWLGTKGRKGGERRESVLHKLLEINL